MSKTCRDCVYYNAGDKTIDLWIYCSEPAQGIYRCGKHGCLLVDERNGIRDIEICDSFADAAEHRKLFEAAKAEEAII